MNTTTSSRLSQQKSKPDRYRVFLKSRNSPFRAQDARQSLNQLPLKIQSQQPSFITSVDNIADMKDYVRNRIKTQMRDYTDGHMRTSSQVQNGKLQTTPLEQIYGKRFTEASRPLSKVSSKNSIRESKNKSPRLTSSVIDKIQPIQKSKIQSKTQLEQYELRLQILLQKRLAYCSKHKKNRNGDLQQQLQKVIVELKQLKSQQEDSQNIQQDIQHLRKKIQLFQRLMAQNMAESDIMKKYLLSKLTNHSKFKKIKTELSTLKQTLPPFRQQRRQQRKIINGSINADTFKKPNHRMFPNSAYKQLYFNADRHKQPLPRSSYNRDFLIYDLIPDKEMKPIDNAIIAKSMSHTIMRTSYQDAFQTKKAQRCNHKELDACKDKIKNMPVLYGRVAKALTVDNTYMQKPLTKNRNTYQKLSYSKRLLSQSRRQFAKQINKPIHSEIRHKNLYDLKYHYKKQANC